MTNRSAAIDLHPVMAEPSPPAAHVGDTAMELPGWELDNLDFPTFRITLLGKAMDRMTTRQLAEQGELSYAAWRVLARLGTRPEGATVGQIADMAWVDRAEVSRAVTMLEQRGLTARRENTRDRRTPILHITASGRSLYKSILADRIAFHEKLLTGLTLDERNTLDSLLSRIGVHILNQLDAVTVGPTGER